MSHSSNNGKGRGRPSWRRRQQKQPPARSGDVGHRLGVLEWFRPGEHDRVDHVLSDMAELGVTELRTGISWADVCTPEGEAWYAWLLPQLARRVNVLPCFVDTPPGWGVAPRSSAPPGNLKSYADFLDVLITRYGRYFEWIELWNEPNDPRKWDAELDPYWWKFSEMIGNAAYWAQHRGKKTVLGGMRPIDPNWLRLMGERGLLKHIDAVGVHAFPGASDEPGTWKTDIDRIRDVLVQFNPAGQVWITETGYSTWRHDERRQLTALIDALDAPAERVYWYSLHDLDPRLATGDGFHADERDYHYGLKRADGGAKLLYRLWAEGGLDAVRDVYWLGKSAHVGNGRERPVLITGGCGFIGTNLARRIMAGGRSVLIFDNLSRAGVEQNLKGLREAHGHLLRVEAADVQDPHVLRSAVARASQVFHLAAQVAVTTSLVNAVHDFDVNARGTLNLLEAIRSQDEPPPLVYTSTNKVYGALPDLSLHVSGNRYEPEDDRVSAAGISEERALDFHSPYGCSKGTADQYVLDYSRTFGLPAAVFRMSCIYGPHQRGNEDQGWVAHFLIRALCGDPITIYGDGMQVRDILYVEDLVDAFLLAQAKMRTVSGHAFNIGGGPENTISLIELLDLIESLHGVRPEIRSGAWRPGDQRYYVSDTSKMRRMSGWSPRVVVEEGVGRLYEWLGEYLGKSRRARLATRGRLMPGRDAWSADDAKSAPAASTPSEQDPHQSRREIA
jgi:CDP-paratose 2-epimerase